MKLRDRLKHRKLRREPIDLPEWQEAGETLYVTVLSGTERFELEQWMEQNRGFDLKVNNLLLMCKMCVLALVDGDGKKVFTDEDMDTLKDQEGSILLEVFQAALRLNRMTKEDQEELARNFPRAVASSSGIDLPNGSACPSGAA